MGMTARLKLFGSEPASTGAGLRTDSLVRDYRLQVP